MMPSGEGGGAGSGPRITENIRNNREAAESEAEIADAQVEQIITKSIEKEQERNRILQQRASILGEIGKMRSFELEMEKSFLTNANIALQDLKREQEVEQAKLDLVKQQIDQMTLLSEDRRKKLKEEIQSAKNAGEVLDILQKQAGKMEDMKQTQEDLNNIGKKVATTFGMQADTSATILGQTTQMIQKLEVIRGEQGFGGVALSIGTAAMEAFSLERVMASIVESAFEFAKEMDNASKAFGKTTGFDIAGVNDQLLEASRMGELSGVTITKAGSAFTTLSSNMSNFKMSAGSANVELIETVTLLENIGVTGASSTKSLDIMTAAMGRTNEEANKLTITFATMGRSINVHGSKMIEQFNNNASELISFGPKMESVFKNLAIQAKLTGISMQSLINTAKKFDTFESATKQVAQMNAVLGTNLSSMELMNMTHDERIAKIREEVKASVGNFNTLDRYSQMYIQQAMGVGSVEEASRLLNMSQSEYLDNQSKMQEAADTQEKLAELTKEYVPMLEKMKLNFMAIVREFDPLIKGFANILQFFADSPNLLKGLIGAVAVLRVGLLLAGSAAGYASAQMGAFTLAIQLIALGFGFIMGGDYAMGISIMIAGVILLGVSFRYLRKEVEDSTGKFGLLAKIFGKKINPPFINAFAHMAVGVVMMALALKLVSGQGIIAAVAMALLAGAFALAFYAFAAMTTAIKELIEVFIGSVDILPQVAAGMYMIAGAMLAMGFAAMVSAYSMLIFLTGFGAIAAIVAIATGVEALNSMGESMDAIGSGMERFANGLAKVVGIAKEMTGISQNAFMAFSTKGSETSAIISSNDLIKTAVSGKINVDVNIPEIKSPTVNLSVYLNGFKLDINDNDIARVVVGAAQ